MRKGSQADWTEYWDNETTFILVMNLQMNQWLIIALLHSLETQPFIFFFTFIR